MTKRSVEEAYRSFFNSQAYNDIAGKLNSKVLTEPSLFGKKTGDSQLEELYKYVYELYDDENDINKAVSDYIKDWARSSYLQKMSLVKGYINEHPSNTPKTGATVPGKNITAADAEAMSRPGSGADRGISSDSGKEIKEAQRIEAGKRAVEDYNADKNAGKDRVIPFDESTVAIGSADEGVGKLSELSSHLVSILGLDGVRDTGKVKSSLERLKEESDYETYGDALKTASNIRELCKRIYKYEPKYRFGRNFVDDNDVLAQKVLNAGAGFWTRVSNVVTGGSKSSGGNEQELIRAYTSASGQKKRISKLTDDELIKLIEDIKAYYPKEVSWFKYVKGTLADANLTRRSVERANGYISLWDKDVWGEVKRRLQNEGRPGDAISIADKLLSANLMPGCENGLNAIKLHMQALALSKGVNAGESGSINKSALNVGGKK